MREVIIGSSAIKKTYPDFPREPSDLDIVVNSKEGLKNSKGIEYHLNPVLMKYALDEYASPDMILTLKLSHMFWDINWEKHLFDIQWLLKKGHKYQPKVLDELIGYWEETKEIIIDELKDMDVTFVEYDGSN